MAPSSSPTPAERVTRDPDPLLLSISDAATRLGVGRSMFCELIYSGRIRSLKVGRRRLIPAAALVEYVASLLDAEAAS